MKRLAQVFLSPIFSELPFFLSYFFLMGVDIFRYFHGRIITYDEKITYFDLIGRLCFLILQGYIFTSLIYYSSSRFLKIGLYGLCLFFFYIQLFLFLKFGLELSPSVIAMIGETTSNESTEFFNTFIWRWDNLGIFISIPILIVLIFLIEKWNSKHCLRTERFQSFSFFFFGILISILFYGMDALRQFCSIGNIHSTDHLERWRGTVTIRPNDILSELTFSIYGLYVRNEERLKEIEITSKAVSEEELYTTINDTLSIILVVGESYIKWHSPLYGYDLNTTPSLMKEKEAGKLFAFNDVITPYPSTSEAVKNMFCCNNVSEYESWSQSPFFPAFFKRTGYSVTFFDNQRIGDTEGGIYAFSLNSLLYEKKMIDMSYSATNKKNYSFDGELIDNYIKEMCGSRKEKELAIFHLMGQHVDAVERFPNDKFTHFTTDSIKRPETWMTDRKKQRIANYDNATYYNDFVISKIIQEFNDKTAVMLYLSDHGEEVYDYRDSEGRKVGRNITRNLAKYIFEIPFIIWCSKKYARKYPDEIEMIKRAVNRPFSSDNVCQLLFHLGGIKTKYYNPKRDPLSNDFESTARIISGTMGSFHIYEEIRHKGND